VFVGLLQKNKTGLTFSKFGDSLIRVQGSVFYSSRLPVSVYQTVPPASTDAMIWKTPSFWGEISLTS